ncbi:MAG: bifunctional nicotinamidase/pyrazinamidase [Blastocatellia bacterium]
MMNKKLEDSALVLVDIQNDFCPGGALAVAEGDQVVEVVNRLMPLFPLTVSTQDWHPANHISFKERGGPWPPHCVQGTRGAELHPALDTGGLAYYFRKASSPDRDAYSEFEGVDDRGRTLDETLKGRGVKRIFVAGLATDYCVLATVLDGLSNGYEVYAITDAMRAVNVDPDDGRKALEEMARKGAHLTVSEELLKGDEPAGAAAP